ncbi:conserved membrane hypothetical protein [Hyella patelloides LEGE 07179]|uniref:Uncharacterized protein n=1 Tax=Hyella patelloides LEGE 07179 TaxID=945734 RepID=A0A563VRD0_9CYAN|nr:DUF5367 domain-containing protein [Hyella patelloides]VEP13959.1 conserved membrane hypothetical protein [Hyella patelloides LEGE 07179]
MNTKNQISFFLLGVFIWAIATIVYRLVGSYFFEGSSFAYWLNVIATGIVFSAVSLGLMKWQHIEAKDWLQGAICLALPGMLGEIPILSSFSQIMSNMQPETAGRYGAFLFGGYGLLIGFAWLISTRANENYTPLPR